MTPRPKPVSLTKRRAAMKHGRTLTRFEAEEIARWHVTDTIRRIVSDVVDVLRHDIDYKMHDRMQGLQRELRLFRTEYTKWRRQEHPTEAEALRRETDLAGWVDWRNGVDL